MTAPARPRVFTAGSKVFVQWPDLPHALMTTVVHFGRHYCDDKIGYTDRLPVDAVELRAAEQSAYTSSGRE